MTEDIKDIVNKSINAPSGDNAQPWRFVIKNESLFLYNIPGGDKTVYNYLERGSYIAHGAVLENISIISSHKGFSADIKIFPEGSEKDLIAEIRFTKTSPGNPEFYDEIFFRSTNRKKYKPEKLPRSFFEKIRNYKKEGVNLFGLEDADKIRELAKLLSLNERLILENYNIHQPLFSYIRWTKEEEKMHGDGLYIKTLELEAPAEKAFKLFRNWKVIKFLSRFGIPKLVSKDTEKLYATSAAFILLTVENNAPRNYVDAGRVLQKIWLAATKERIALQPTAALYYLAARIEDGNVSLFTQEEINEIKNVHSRTVELFESKGKVAMLFRLGYADPPSAVSIKKQPEIIVENI
ncbi:MAG TPA: hypothetical protein VEC17_03065 [Candidatus Binatia bacterium]|nr:hypothetical protein [Candidatus Binatia bacterium]